MPGIQYIPDANRQLRFYWGIFALLVFSQILAGCTRMASTPMPIMSTESIQFTPTSLRVESSENKPARISIVGVKVTQGSGIFIRGETDLPDGNCIRTELHSDQKIEEWWPSDICIEVASGRWEILVPLGRRGAPFNLEVNVQYVIHAWWPENEKATRTYFPFDLTGPP